MLIVTFATNHIQIKVSQETSQSKEYFRDFVTEFTKEGKFGPSGGGGNLELFMVRGRAIF